MAAVHAVYKPPGYSSYDVVRWFKQRYPGEKIGHGGTLDPFAEGVLVIGVGREATKKLGVFLTASRKTYQATMMLGIVSSTDDPEGKKTTCVNPLMPSRSTLDALAASFIGEQWQTPPIFSAAHVGGKRAYDLARQGKPVVVPARLVVIDECRVLAYEAPYVEIEVVCGSGTYIRSIARAWGEKLLTGAYLTRLVRTEVAVAEPVAGVFTTQTAERLPPEFLRRKPLLT